MSDYPTHRTAPATSMCCLRKRSGAPSGAPVSRADAPSCSAPSASWLGDNSVSARSLLGTEQIHSTPNRAEPEHYCARAPLEESLDLLADATAPGAAQRSPWLDGVRLRREESGHRRIGSRPAGSCARQGQKDAHWSSFFLAAFPAPDIEALLSHCRFLPIRFASTCNEPEFSCT